MSFTQNIERTITVEVGKNGVVSRDGLCLYLSGIDNVFASVSSDFGRIYFAGMMYDRCRIRLVFVFVRPKVMFSAVGVSNYTLHLAWDCYVHYLSMFAFIANPRVVIDDLSAKMIVWFLGGNASILTHRVYSTYKDCYQYLVINHDFSSFGDLTIWYPSAPGGISAFYPTLHYVFDIGVLVGSSLVVKFIFQYRFIIEFMGVVFMGYGSDAPVFGCSFGVMLLAFVKDDPDLDPEV